MKRVFSLPEKGQSPIKFCWQSSQGNYVAIASSGTTESSTSIYDRHGELKSEIFLPGACTGMHWDSDGDILATICDKSSVVYLWDANTQKTTQMESGMRDSLSFLLWSKKGSLLAIGTVKGNLLIYNHATSRKVPILGKHTRRITCGAWSQENLLALGSDDKSVSISNSDGDTQRQSSLRDAPSDIQFSEMKTDERSTMGQNTVSCIIGKKTLFLYNLNDPENPVELAFQQRYGNVISYRWYGDGYIMIGFSCGFFIVISTHIKEIGQELFQARDHKDSLTGIAISSQLGRCASAGDSSVKIHDLSDIRELTAIINIEDDRAVDKCSWTDDGQLLGVSTAKGGFYVFLTKLPSLGAKYGSRVAHLTSLLEVTLKDVGAPENAPQLLTIDVEPTFIGLGPDHIAVGMNNRAWFYRISHTGLQFLHTMEYLGTVQSLFLNSEYAAAGLDGKIMLHILEGESLGAVDEQKERRLFPDQSRSDERITHHYMTNEFLIYSTDKGDLNYFYLTDWKYVNEYHHVTGIRKIFPNANGTRVIFIDDKCEAFIYNPVNDQLVDIPNFSTTTKTILWDSPDGDNSVFVGADEAKLYTYIFHRDFVPLVGNNDTPGYEGHNQSSNKSGYQGPKSTQCSLVGITKLPYGHTPLLMHKGQLTLLTQSGKLLTTTLGTHTYLSHTKKVDAVPEADLLTYFEQACHLCKFKDAWIFAEKLNRVEVWDELGKMAMKTLNIDFAIRVYQHIGDGGNVFALTGIQGLEDRNLLSGYMAMFLSDFNVAQDLFLASSYPQAALEMRRDLLHWDSALQLAKALAPNQIPFISKEYASQLEFTGDHVNALIHYEKSVTRDPDCTEHDEACGAGIARMAIRLGDSKRGLQMALSSKDRNLKKDCAAILEQMKQWQDAAMLYEEAVLFEKAVSVYIRWKNWTKVGQLLPKVQSPKLHLLYAKAREADGKYKEAAVAYENARDWDSVIRLNLEHLNNPEEAVRVVRDTRSVEGAKMVAQFFIRLNDYPSAIQFLVMSKCLDEAFKLAQAHRQMETYADIIGSEASPEEYQSIALHFENEKNSYLAGKFFLLAGQYEKAMKHLLRVPYTEDSVALDLAIETVGQANDDKLTHQLIDYLMGETDNVPKDAKYLFRLYMALGQFREAARTAIIIAREEQNGGNYRVGHDLLFSMTQELKQHKIRIPAEMVNSLMLLHSYMTAKMHIKKGDHMKGARLLIRVAENISKFPSHVVPILTSTVIECHRSGLKNSSFSYAAMLMRPEYRDQVDVKYKKKLEGIVRRPDKTEEEEAQTQCPHCSSNLPAYQLYCTQCKNNIPYCVVTGQHMVKSEFSACPNCDFPALHMEFLTHIEGDDPCPMCNERVSIDRVKKIPDPSKYLVPEVPEEKS